MPVTDVANKLFPKCLIHGRDGDHGAIQVLLPTMHTEPTLRNLRHVKSPCPATPSYESVSFFTKVLAGTQENGFQSNANSGDWCHIRNFANKF